MEDQSEPPPGQPAGCGAGFARCRRCGLPGNRRPVVGVQRWRRMINRGAPAAPAAAAAGVIRTRRLTLRQLELSDAGFILELLNEAAFLRFIGDKGVRDLDHARDYIRKGPIDSYERYGFGLY